MKVVDETDLMSWWLVMVCLSLDQLLLLAVAVSLSSLSVVALADQLRNSTARLRLDAYCDIPELQRNKKKISRSKNAH